MLVEKHQQNHNLIYFSLTLSTLMFIHSYNMGDKIKRLNEHEYSI
jgi:hypothetical protein